MNNFREILTELIKNSCECYFESDVDKLFAIQSLKLFFDRYEFEEFSSNQNITQEEYKKYFKAISKKYKPWIHIKAKQYYKEKKNET